jgi:hypothetical protein
VQQQKDTCGVDEDIPFRGNLFYPNETLLCIHARGTGMDIELPFSSSQWVYI